LDNRGSVPGGGNDGIFFFATAFKPALGQTEPPIQWVLGALTARVKHTGREADHSAPSSDEFNNAWSYTS